MRRTLLLFLLLLPVWSFGQNYQCLQAGVKHYFINGNNYLKGIRIDSVRTAGSDVVYYPFHTARGSYNAFTPGSPVVLDSAGGSWLGKKVVQKSDGTFLFDSYWNDTVVIKTQALAGDSWIMYNDSGIRYYKATMISIDTSTVLGVSDSIKTIMITAWEPTGIVVSDPLDSIKIILSKNHGFVQTLDLYTFPYHKPDSTYRPGLDFMLDRALGTTNTINNTPGLPYVLMPEVLLFKLTNFVNPTEQQLRDWNIGDVIHSDNELGIPMFGTVTTHYLRDTIVGKAIAGHMATYTISGSYFD